MSEASSEVRIVRYRASWNHQTHVGVFDLSLQGGQAARVEVADATEFGLVFQILQNDTDPFLVDGAWISTGVEHPGRPGIHG